MAGYPKIRLSRAGFGRLVNHGDKTVNTALKRSRPIVRSMKAMPWFEKIKLTIIEAIRTISFPITIRVQRPCFKRRNNLVRARSERYYR